VVEREHTSRCCLALSLRLPLPAASIVGGLRFVSAHKLAGSACRNRCYITLFRELSGQAAIPAPHITGRLLAVSPDIAEFLAGVTLRESSLGFVRLYQLQYGIGSSV
jgi:hypothetical protein